MSLFPTATFLIPPCAAMRVGNDEITKRLEEEKSFPACPWNTCERIPTKGEAVGCARHGQPSTPSHRPLNTRKSWETGLASATASLGCDRTSEMTCLDIHFCVLKRGAALVVVDYLSAMPSGCTLESTQRITTGCIESGNMEFSGRTDDWFTWLRS
jgi:hypothetical protein